MHNWGLFIWMKRFKKLLRLCGLVLFLLLAAGGVSLTGIAPVPPKNRRMINTETVIDMEEDNKQEQGSPADEAFY
jgi:CHASE3 domain sensor protein